MIFSTAVVLLSLVSNVVSQPSPAYNNEPLKFSLNNELCKDSLMEGGKTRIIKPSDTNKDGYVGPLRKIGTNWYTTDRPHYVIGSPNEGPERDNLNIFLHGTSSSPYRHTCILEGISSDGTPTIGLSYASLNAVDSKRNEMCGTESDTDQCLTDQHEQAIKGGDTRPKLWDKTDARDSIIGRIEALILYLQEKYPDEGWDRFSKANGSLMYSKIVILGHSQGSGHSAYLAQMKMLAGAGLLSGPQDECIGCKEGTQLWVDDPFKTFAITGLAGADASATFEPSIPVITDNWNRMAATKSISWSGHGELELRNIGFGLEGGYDVCKNPLVSSLEAAAPSTSEGPGKGSQCGRAGHCSIGVDDSTPVLNRINATDLPILLLHAWPEIASAPKCNCVDETGTFKLKKQKGKKDEKKSCEWASSGNTKKKCKTKLANNKKFKDVCPKTCGVCK